MLFEDKSTQCPNCQKPLTWISHSIRWVKTPIHEFNFSCGSCNRKFDFEDNQLTERQPQRGLAAETTEIHKAQHRDAVSRRCPTCGGPIKGGGGYFGLSCDWCHQEYVLEEGELMARSPDLTETKPKMNDFYALHTGR
jgi:endogenous inhibitor of DNA gyrase (YacG/DUF329 family)